VVSVTPPVDEDKQDEHIRTEADFGASLRRSRARRAVAARLRARRRRTRGSGGALTAAVAAVALLAPLAVAQDASPTAAPAAGSQGLSVAGIQRALGVPATGRYDAATRAAVRAFQRRSGLTVDGIVGPKTRRALRALAPAVAPAVPQEVAGAAAFSGGAAAGTSASPTGEAAATLARIARCESGGDPTAVSADGRYRGKYQFTRATWKQLGGTGDPAAAPEADQDRLAAQLLADQGTAPWPVCGGG
jgi:hypothetical protein